MTDYRIERLEEVLIALKDDMGDVKKALVELTRIDTIQAQMAQRLDNIDQRMNKHSETIDQIQIALATMSNRSATNEWFIRVLIAAAVGVVAYIIKT